MFAPGRAKHTAVGARRVLAPRRAVTRYNSRRVEGGHVAVGCRVRTTAEILLAILPGWNLARRRDSATGYPELVIRRDD